MLQPEPSGVVAAVVLAGSTAPDEQNGTLQQRAALPSEPPRGTNAAVKEPREHQQEVHLPRFFGGGAFVQVAPRNQNSDGGAAARSDGAGLAADVPLLRPSKTASSPPHHELSAPMLQTHHPRPLENAGRPSTTPQQQQHAGGNTLNSASPPQGCKVRIQCER